MVPTLVEIWRVRIDQSAPPPAALRRCTTAEERHIAARMIVPGAARRFLACRAALRCLLADRLPLAPEEIPLRRGPHGKPELAPPWHDRWQFNVAHSASLGLVALCPTAAVGIDLERQRPLERFASLVRVTLSPRERDALDRLPPPQRLRQWFRYWTHKEAVLKATGAGLSLPPTAVELAPDRRGTLRVVRCDAAPRGARCVRELHLGPRYCGAVAAEADTLHVVWHRWRQPAVGRAAAHRGA